MADAVESLIDSVPAFLFRKQILHFNSRNWRCQKLDMILVGPHIELFEPQSDELAYLVHSDDRMKL